MIVAQFTETQQKEKLREYCEWKCLVIGRYAIANRVSPEIYFRRYGLAVEALQEMLVFNQDYLNTWFGTTELKEVLALCQERYGLESVWVPRNIHVYEAIQKKFPQFSWVIDKDKRSIKFVHYPYQVINKVGYYPSLYELVSDKVTVDPNYWLTPPPKRERLPDNHRARRHVYRSHSLAW